MSCDNILACEKEWGQEEVDGEIRKWLIKDCKFKGNCQDCRDWYAAGKPDAHQQCLDAQPEHIPGVSTPNPKVCDGASFNNPYCDFYIGKGESKTF
nr:hypothetical protein [Candidatus Dadabacteria bacterium]NIV41708.1 hypothetical protein [Candidatus Dadabacteria bacterium]NIX15740.1 hypothetical protein [Candidatus Dadabacteria bacterium]